MSTPVRFLRACVDNQRDLRPQLSARELDREDRILAAARGMLAHHGRAGLTMAGFATALRISTTTIRRHFPDIDCILAELLMRHLLAISRALGEIPFDHPTRQAAKRAAYITATRTAFSAPTELHLLLIRERHALPPDLAGPIEEVRNGIGEMLADDQGAAALALLDTPTLQHPQIESMLAALAARNPAAAALGRSKTAAIIFPKSTRQALAVHPASANTPATPRARAGPS